MTIPLRCTQDTSQIEKMIRGAARRKLGRYNLSTFYEHGQWWVEHRPSGAQWSVADEASQDGFCFEQVTEGDVA